MSILFFILMGVFFYFIHCKLNSKVLSKVMFVFLAVSFLFVMAQPKLITVMLVVFVGYISMYLVFKCRKLSFNLRKSV